MTRRQRADGRTTAGRGARFMGTAAWGWACLAGSATFPAAVPAADPVRFLQTEAIRDDRSPLGYWGTDPAKYTGWNSHSNRLIPVYTIGTLDAGPGIDLRNYTGENSPYRSAEKVRNIYGYLPAATVHPQAEHLDQTNVCDLLEAAAAAGRKHVILFVFDGLDWHVTRAGSIVKSRKIEFDSGRGKGFHFQDYTAAGTTQYGWMATSPHSNGFKTNVDLQQVAPDPKKFQLGGYDPTIAGFFPWSVPERKNYLLGKPEPNGGIPFTRIPAYTDSSSSAVSMTAGAKTYNNAVNVDPLGRQILTLPHRLQAQGRAVGVVTSVPISHATPAAAYAHNVHRSDFQDLTRDLLGLPSISHPRVPLSGVDVLLGAGWGENVSKEDQGDDDTPFLKMQEQGENFVPGNRYLTAADRRAVDVDLGGRYVVAERTPGKKGSDLLRAAGRRAIADRSRLFGFFGRYQGTNSPYGSHLPTRTADGDFNTTVSAKMKLETYSQADLDENPTLAEMAETALDVLAQNPKGFWLLVEAGDVDWACHANNIDSAIGAIRNGDAAVKAITDWVERHDNWRDTVMIVTADHGHSFYLLQPELLIDTDSAAK